MTTALLFPGQGSQRIGMGRSLAEAFPLAAETFEEANDVLGLALSRIAWEGPDTELVLTRNAQPAILTHSVAALRVLDDALDGTAMAAGHSLGEFSAYVAAGALSFSDALQVVRLRGELMAAAGERRPGTMAAVLGMSDDAAEELCQEISAGDEGTVVLANFNAPGQIVISGDVSAVSRAVALAPERGAKRVVSLNVSGAFHSPLMEPAEEGLRRGLGSVSFDRPRYPVYSNVTAGAVSDGDTASDLLVRQLASPVRWKESVRAMVDAGAERFVELGPGRVLTGLNKRNAHGVPTQAAGETEDLDAFE